MIARLSLLGLSMSLAGCPGSATGVPVSSPGSGGGSGSCAACRHGDPGGRGSSSSSGSASGSSATSGSGTGGGGTTGGVQGGGLDGGCLVYGGTPPRPLDCNSAIGYDGGAAGGCPADWFGTVVIDFSSCEPVCGATVQLLDAAGQPLPNESQVSDSYTGGVHLCLPAGLTYTPSVSAPGYPTFYFGEIAGQVGTSIAMFGVLQTTEIAAMQSLIPGGVDPSKASVIFGFDRDSCASRAGWTISLAFEDGGAYPPGSYAVYYFDANGIPSASQTATSTIGTTLVANIDTTLGSFVVPIYGNPDAGCSVQNAALGYTGRLYVQPGRFSEQTVYLE